MTKTAIIVLGAPNDAQGRLSSMAIERCQQALSEYRCRPGSQIIPTGGWGYHFNTADRPHGHYVRLYLEAQGVPAADILECAESANTIEDAQLSRPIIERHGIGELVVVTSDFHVPRARFIFEREFPELRLTFPGAKTNLPEDELARRKQHEETALAKLQQQH
jgi:uncharacterized SAM-binding protein YcdF (DUF218 family)